MCYCRDPYNYLGDSSWRRSFACPDLSWQWADHGVNLALLALCADGRVEGENELKVVSVLRLTGALGRSLGWKDDDDVGRGLSLALGLRLDLFLFFLLFKILRLVFGNDLVDGDASLGDGVLDGVARARSETSLFDHVVDF